MLSSGYPAEKIAAKTTVALTTNKILEILILALILSQTTTVSRIIACVVILPFSASGGSNF